MREEKEVNGISRGYPRAVPCTPLRISIPTRRLYRPFLALLRITSVSVHWRAFLCHPAVLHAYSTDLTLVFVYTSVYIQSHAPEDFRL